MTAQRLLEFVKRRREHAENRELAHQTLAAHARAAGRVYRRGRS